MEKRFDYVKVGDRVLRMLAGSIPMELIVSSVTDDLIVCGGDGSDHIGWWFDKVTGAEIDEDLDWGPPPRMTGSYIVHGYDPKIRSIFSKDS